MTKDQLLKENELRKEEHPYDPKTGLGCYGKRTKVKITEFGVLYLPDSFLSIGWINRIVKAGSVASYCTKYKLEGSESQIIKFFIQERYKHDPEFWFATQAKIKIKNGRRDDYLIVSKTQRKVLYEMLDDWFAGKPVRCIIVKCRQAFITTLMAALNTWVQVNIFESWDSLICGDVENQASNVRGMQDKMISGVDTLFSNDKKLYFAPFEGSTKTRILVGRDCKVSTGSMQKPENVRSGDNSSAHCLVPSTPVITENGIIKTADSLIIGDVVYTHNGNKTKIIGIYNTPISKENGNGSTVIIKTWLGGEIELTPNHPIYTKRGWVNAGQLTKDDLLSMPVRKINHTIFEDKLPMDEYRPHGGGKKSFAQGETIKFNEGTGFAFGYFLAEGSINYNGERPVAVVFSRHRNEKEYADMACMALNGLYLSRNTSDRRNSFTTTETLYGASLARFIINTLGTKINKHIPDWFFDCGEDFLRGLLKGYLSGDGSKTIQDNKSWISATILSRSISSSITTQIRDIALSLGYGWASLSIKNEGFHYGRNCQKCYSLHWHGESARKLCRLITTHNICNGHKYSEKSFVENGYNWVKIKSISKGVATKIYDIEVEHEDHSFRTLYFSVKNCTEVGLWKTTQGKTPEDLIQAIRGGMDDVAYTVFSLESSPKGTGNYFYRQWQAAKKGESDLKPIFLPWFLVPRYSKKIDDYDEFFNTFFNGEKKDYLQYLWSLGTTLEQINWYIGKLKTMEHWRVQSEFPSDDVEAFQSTGSRAFGMAEVQRRRQECIPPVFVGDIYGKETKGEDALKGINIEKRNTNLKIWAYPDKDEIISDRYLVIVDIGKGKSTKSDFSDILVLDRYGLMFGDRIEVIAEWHGRIDVDLLAWKAAQIGTYYKSHTIAFLAIEKNTIDTLTEYHNILFSELNDWYDNLYAKVEVDKTTNKTTKTLGFHTNSNTKPLVVETLQSFLRDDLYYERNEDACVELDTYELKEDGKYGATDGCHDDMVMVRAIGMYISTKMPMPKVIVEHEVKIKKIVGLSSM